MGSTNLTEFACDHCGHTEVIRRRDAERPLGWWLIGQQEHQGGGTFMRLSCPDCVASFKAWRASLGGDA